MYSTEASQSELNQRHTRQDFTNSCAKLLQLCPTLRPHGLWPARFLCPWDSPGKNIGVGCHFLLWGIFPTQGSDHISCGSCIAGGFFIAKPPGKPSAGTYERFILIFTVVEPMCIPTNRVQRFPFFTSSPKLIFLMIAILTGMR